MAANKNTLGVYSESFLGNSFSSGYPIQENIKRNTFEPYQLYPQANKSVNTNNTNKNNKASRATNPLLAASSSAPKQKEFSKFPGQKYAGENHFPGYNYLGPGTRTDYRLDAGKGFDYQKGEAPVNKLDRAAYWHDVAYQKINDAYNANSNSNGNPGKTQRTNYMGAIHSADKRFMSDAFYSGVQPLGAISAGLIGMKMLGEKSGLLSSKRFSGIK